MKVRGGAPLLLLSLLSLGLAGCGGGTDVSDIQAKMDAIQQKPQGQIKPPPEFKPAETFNYAANQLRSPFIPPAGFAQMQSDLSANAVKPDQSRPREYLERFSLDQLKMVGTIKRPGKALQALILDTNGRVTRVRVGNYLGRNFGRITKVTANSVSLMEIAPTGRNAWVERPRVLSIKRPAQRRAVK